MIRIIITLLVTVLSFATTFAQEKHNITINFYGMETNEGKLYVALYNSEDTFLKTPYKGEIVEVTDLKSTAIFKDIPTGEYAVSAFHDVNNNEKMDTKIFGIPKEPIGTSNDAKGFMGPPKFKKAKFKVDQNTTIKVKIEDIF